MARAHRIGQKKVVNVYRFVSKDTIDEEIIERAKRKMVLEYCIIKNMDTSGKSLLSKEKSTSSSNISKEELQTILKFGAQNLFKQHEESAQANQNKLEQLDLDDILARAENTESSAPDAVGAADGGADFLEQWKVSDFGASQLNWDDLIPEKERQTETIMTQEELELFAGRRRANISYSDNPIGQVDVKAIKKSRSSAKKRKNGSPTEMTEHDVRALSRSIQRFGDIEMRYDDIVEDAQLEEKDRSTVMKCYQEIVQACTNALLETHPEMKEKGAEMIALSLAQKAKAVSAVVSNVNINAGTLISRLVELRTLAKRMQDMEASNISVTSFRLRSALKAVTNWTCAWGHKDDAMLLVGIFRHGFASWDIMQLDDDLGFKTKFFLGKQDKANDAKEEGADQEEKPAVEEKDNMLPKSLHLQRRGEYLLKLFCEEESTRSPVKPPRSKARAKAPSKASSSDNLIDATFEPIPNELIPEEDDGEFKLYGYPKQTKKKTAKKIKEEAPKKSSTPRSTAPKPKPLKQKKLTYESSSYESMDDNDCKSLMRPLKAELKTLRDKTDTMDPTMKGKFLKDTISTIGTHIDSVCVAVSDSDAKARREKHLWKFASYFWPSRTSSIPIRNMYYKLKGAREETPVAQTPSDPIPVKAEVKVEKKEMDIDQPVAMKREDSSLSHDLKRSHSQSPSHSPKRPRS